MDIAITIISSLLSGIIATLITVNYYKKQEKRQRKLDLLSNVLRNMNALVPPIDEELKKTLGGYLNEAYIVFNDNIEVLRLLDEMKAGVTETKLVTTVKSMCKVLKIDYSNINDEFITKPFH